MQQKWVLHIEEFAKIKKADIEIAPFLVFIGENNSGKSYLMTLFWGLLVLGKTIFPKSPPKNESYKRCVALIENKLELNEYKLTNEDELTFVEFYNSILNDKKNTMLKDIFSTNDLSIKKLEIKNYTRNNPLILKFIKQNDEKQRFSSGKNYVKFPIDKNNITNDKKYKIIQYICWKLLMEDLTAPLFPIYDRKRTNGEPIFLPASRTGFMLTYRALTSDVMNAWGIDGEIDTKFTLPVIKFLQILIQQKERKNYLKDVVEFLEKDILEGDILSEEGIINKYTYKARGMKKNISLHITSSLVVELAPLIILLKSNLKYNAIFIEELEAHLHPRLQKTITRVIIKLLNKNSHIIITTHSDVIFQHINNMIKLSNAKNQKMLLEKLNYSEDDILDSKKARVYEFKIVNGKTEVIPLKLTKEGFEVPSFNNALIDLAEETMMLNEAINE
jgi:predicted ATPase